MIQAFRELVKLQDIEFGVVTDKAAEKQIAELRAAIPAPILAHYDRLRVRDKKGIVAIRNQVCTGCHMGLPIGKITVVMRGEDIQLCENCGRYLYMPEGAGAGAIQQAAVAAPKPATKPRKKKAVATAAQATV
jgi:predicted  nucleic acid-binding Zn-ribbon protein